MLWFLFFIQGIDGLIVRWVIAVAAAANKHVDNASLILFKDKEKDLNYKVTDGYSNKFETCHSSAHGQNSGQGNPRR